MSILHSLQNIYKNGISGSTLKIIAIVTMVTDHIGAIILEQLLIQRGILEVSASQVNAFLEANGAMYYTDMILRTIGRISFPIFCFLIVQGFLHTHNIKKYLIRILMFAFISEIPFDLAFSNSFIDLQYQNIFFTLFFGILAMIGIQIAEQKKEWNTINRILFGILSIGLCIVAAKFLKTDYDIYGVSVIVIMYIFKRWKTLSAGLGCVALMSGIPPFVSLVPIHLYNGKKGRNIKWLFYLFYPIHILILYLISYFLI